MAWQADTEDSPHVDQVPNLEEAVADDFTSVDDQHDRTSIAAGTGSIPPPIRPRSVFRRPLANSMPKGSQ